MQLIVQTTSLPAVLEQPVLATSQIKNPVMLVDLLKVLLPS